VLGSPGGSSIIALCDRSLIAHLDWAMDVQQVVAGRPCAEPGSASMIWQEGDQGRGAGRAFCRRWEYEVRLARRQSGLACGISLGPDDCVAG